MALQKEKIPLSITDGVDTKTDSKNVLLTKFLEVVNGDYTKTGSLSKRLGYEPLPRLTSSGSTIDSAKALTAFKDELLLYTQNSLNTFSTAENAWIDKGTVTMASLSRQTIYSEPYQIRQVAQDRIGNYLLTCYLTVTPPVPSTTFTCVYVLTDLETNTIITRKTIASSSGFRYLTLSNISNKFVLFFADTTAGALKYLTIPLTDYENPTTPVTVDSWGGGNSPVFYSKRIGNRIYLVNEDTSQQSKVRFFDTALTASSAINLYLNPTGSSSLLSACVSQENTGFIRIGIVPENAQARLFLYNLDLNTQVHTVATIGNDFTSVRSIEDPNDATKSKIVLSRTAATFISSKHVQTGNIGATGTYTLESENFVTYETHSDLVVFNKQVYYMLRNREPLISEYIVSFSGEILATISRDNGYIFGLTTLIDGIDFIPISDSIATIPVVEISEAVNPTLIGSNIAAPMTVYRIDVDFSQSKNYFDAYSANNLMISGGVMRMYDGNRVVEHSFLETPEIRANTDPPPDVELTPGLIGGASYQYATVFAWRDRFGQIHRSRPAFSSAEVIGTAPNFYSIEVRPRYLNLTNKENVEIEVYRTEGNGTTYYKLSGPVLGTTFVNDKLKENFAFIDDVADDALLKGEILYTQGGTIENDAADSSIFVATYKTRVFALLSDMRTLQYSKATVSGFPVEFSSLYKIELDDFGGDGTCVIQMDDNLIIFKKQAIYAMNGEGPNNLGEQDDFRKPQLISSDAGCVNPNSIIHTDAGILFKSSKGIYLLGRNFQVSYIGAPVERFNDLVITSATLLSETNQVRFTTDSDLVLIYDYFHNRWAWYENLPFVDSLIFKDQYYGLKETGFVFEQTSVYNDNGTFIPMSLVSSWVQLGGIQGFQRFYRLLILGTYKGPHKLRVQFAYDFNESWVDEVLIDAADLMNNSVYGDDEFYGDSEVYGGPDSLYQFEIRPKRQKCQSFKFRILDTQDGAILGESMQLSNFALEIGIKRGYNKLSSSNVFGAE